MTRRRVKERGRRTWTLAFALVVATSVACHEADPTADKKPVTPLKVETKPIVERPVPRIVPLTGTLTAELRTELTANSSGRVSKTFVERGQKVEQGALLAQLDVRSAAASAAEANASVTSAKTQLDAAKAECARYDALVARGAITQQEHDKQTANCKQQVAAVAVSQARASSASIAVGDGTIRAPFAGVVTERFVSVGDYVQPTSKVVALVVSNPLRLKMTVPERRMLDVKEGALVTFSPPAIPNRTFTGTVRFMGGEVRPTTRDIVVEAIVPNPDNALLPGMFVDANLHAGEQPMPVVPKTAIFTTGQEKSLYVVKDKRLVLRIVKLGPEAGDDVALEEGAAVGDVAVVKPSPSMSDGAPVE
ncbi:MAG: rane fusion protein multidrug efflux system [Myxococcales bacterium]|nr:rane fusion protein multidrug efflux system [Myxococcales bacterium]